MKLTANDGKAFGAELAKVIKGYIDNQVVWLKGQILTLEQRVAELERDKKGGGNE
jgi:hypothetical protein